MSKVAVGEDAGAFERPPRFSMRDAAPEAPWSGGGEDVEVEVVFDAPIAWWARRQLTTGASVEDQADGSIRVRLPVANVDAFLGWMISFDDQAEILGPDDVRSRFVAMVEGLA